jgi:trk system potassium uptake protein TrkH
MSGRRRLRSVLPSDLATIARDVGSLLAMQALLMALSAGVAVVFREPYAALAFLAAAGITASIGLGTRRLCAGAPDPVMKHGMIIAAGGWFATAVFGALPFLLAAHFTPPSVAASYVPAGAEYGSSLAYFRNPLHAVFESMSGWTGSGLTMAVHEPSLPRAIQWWRSLIQYVGGIGVVVLTVTILSRPGSGSYALYRSEAREEKIHPSIVSTVRTIWKVFLGYTVLSVVALFVAIRLSGVGADLPPWEAGWQALNHAMTGLSTGGFSVTDESIASYDSPLVEGVLLPVMTAGAIAFPVHYGLLHDRDVGAFLRDLQTRWLLVLLAAGVVALGTQNALVRPAGAFEGDWLGLATLDGALGLPALLGRADLVTPAVADALRDSTFQFVSALSCTGFQSSPIGAWGAGGKLIVAGAMVLGGAAGSTVGGIKIVRGYTIARGMQWQFSRVFLPANAVVSVRMDGRTLGREEMEREFSEAAIVSLLWLVLLATSSLVVVNLAGAEFTYADALFEVASAQGNVGLSTGITGPSMNPVLEGLFLLNMWVGRLEIIPVLVFARSILFGLEP